MTDIPSPPLTPPSIISEPPPHWMSGWLLHYVGAASVRHLLTGAAILAQPGWFDGSAFVTLVDYTHLWTWGVAFVFIGGFTITAMACKNRNKVRTGMMLSTTANAVTCFAISWSVVTSWINPGVNDASPFVPLLLLAVTYKDLVVIRNPLSNPLGDYLEEVDLSDLS